jgi:Protein of unknown function (DUF3485)
MKFHWKLAATLALFIPFFCKLNYMFGAWHYSPLDQKDFIFWLIALGTAGCFLFWKYKMPGEKALKGLDYYGFFMLAAAIAVLILSSIKHINTVYLAGSLLFIAGGCWIIWGWRILWLLCPVFFIAALGLPSTSYWVSFLFRNYTQNTSGFSIKLCFAVTALIWLAVCLRYSKKIFIQPEPFFFCLMLAAMGFGYMQISTPAPHGAPICLAIKPSAGNWLGEKTPLSYMDASFTGKNITRRYVHYSNSNARVATLLVELRNDLHQIHPAALCLSTARWKILSHTRELLKTKLGILSVAKIVAKKDNQRVLFLAWYTNDSFSTASFILFRKSWHFNETWNIYQLTTSIITTEAEAEKTLLNFINTFATVK